MTTTARHHFVLYLFGEPAQQSSALTNLKELCDQHLDDAYEVEVVQLHTHPAVAEEKDIFATPTLDREQPAPHIRIVGDLSDTEAVRRLLGFTAELSKPSVKDPEQP